MIVINHQLTMDQVMIFSML